MVRSIVAMEKPCLGQAWPGLVGKAIGLAGYLPAPILRWGIRLAAATFAGTVDLLERATEGFYLLLIRSLLALSVFQGLQHLFHVLKGLPEVIDHVIHHFNGFMNGGGSSRNPLALRLRGAVLLRTGRTLVAPALTAEITAIRALGRAAVHPLRAHRFRLTRQLGLLVEIGGGLFGGLQRLHLRLGRELRLGNLLPWFTVITGLFRFGVVVLLAIGKFFGSPFRCLIYELRLGFGGAFQRGAFTPGASGGFRGLGLAASAASAPAAPPPATPVTSAGTPAGFGLLSVRSTGTDIVVGNHFP